MAVKKVIITPVKKGIYTSNIKATQLTTDHGKEMTPDELYKSMNQYKSRKKVRTIGRGWVRKNSRRDKSCNERQQPTESI